MHARLREVVAHAHRAFCRARASDIVREDIDLRLARARTVYEEVGTRDGAICGAAVQRVRDYQTDRKDDFDLVTLVNGGDDLNSS